MDSPGHSFHCAGIAIKESADKLARELELYENPPVFPPMQESNRVGDDESKPEDG